jgi:ATP-dependent DNA helicase 2 subunit 1
LKSSKGKLELRGKSLSQGLLADTIYLFLLSELELMTVVQCRKKVVMALDELTKIKNVTNVQLQLKGFKPMKCLKDYHNLRPPTFIYPDEEAVQGSYAAFIALHRAMLQQNKFAVAFYGSRASSQLVALVPQEEELADGLQLEPPGMHLIYLPYADDIRPTEKAGSQLLTQSEIATD